MTILYPVGYKLECWARGHVPIHIIYAPFRLYSAQRPIEIDHTVPSYCHCSDDIHVFLFRMEQ